MTHPEYLTLHVNGPLVQAYLAARLERHQAERDFTVTGCGTLDGWSAGNYMEAAWQAEGAAYHVACTERPHLPVGP